jgi:hypothetical protein
MGVSSTAASGRASRQFLIAGFAGSAVRFGLTYAPVRLLEWRLIYLHL